MRPPWPSIPNTRKRRKRWGPNTHGTRTGDRGGHPDSEDAPAGRNGLEHDRRAFRKRTLRNGLAENHDRGRAMTEQQAVHARRHGPGEQPRVRGQDFVQPRARVIVGEQLVGHAQVGRTEGEFGRVARAIDGARENGQLDRNAELDESTPDAARPLLARHRNVPLALAVAHTETSIARHAQRVGVTEIEHQPAATQPFDQRAPLDARALDRHERLGRGRRRRQQQKTDQEPTEHREGAQKERAAPCGTAQV